MKRGGEVNNGRGKIPLKSQSKDLFITYQDPALDGGKSQTAALSRVSSALKNNTVIQRTAGGRSFRDQANNVTIRDEMNRRDYEVYRPSETVPTDPKSIINACLNAASRIGLLRNIMDLMSDFTVQGLEIVHPRPRVQGFYKLWATEANFYNTCERFTSLLYRGANVPVKKQTAKLRYKDIQNLYRTMGEPDIEIQNPPKVLKNEVPYRYTILDPRTIEILGDDLALFAGQKIYGIRVPQKIAQRIKTSKNQTDLSIISDMPQEIINQIRNGAKIIQLDPQKFKMFHYKKDDFQLWAEPMAYAIMDDLVLLYKLKLADLSALDGAISHVRLWRLGSLEHRIFPTEEAIALLSGMLSNNMGGGALDMVWGPELDFKETSTDIHHFLGKEKYAPTMEAIYQGLGVPPTLTGSANAPGFTNNFISLKTLIERLNYGRSVLLSFANAELIEIQEAMGFREPAELRFTHMSLSDESAERALYIQLLDRGVISEETILERFGEIPEIEMWRMKREMKARESEKKPPKAGPFHPPIQPEGDTQVSDAPMGNTPQQGRPKNSKDSGQRKQKNVKVRTSANFFEVFSWACAAQREIDSHINPLLIDSHFSNSEIEDYKFMVLCNLKPFTKIDGKILEKLNSKDLKMPAKISEIINKNSEKIPAGGERMTQAIIYALYGENNGES
jgi:hypothetical protein